MLRVILTIRTKKIMNEFSPAQKSLIISLGKENLHIKEILKRVFGREELDARTAEGREAKRILEEAGIKPVTTQQRWYPEDFPLSQEDMDYIEENVGTIPIRALTKSRFGDVKDFGREEKAVAKFVATIPANLKPIDKKVKKPVIVGEYVPPNRFEQALSLVKRYVDSDITNALLTKQQEKGIQLLVKHMSSYRYQAQISTYEDQPQRDLLESEFVRMTWNKVDLSPEDVGQYIDLCTEIVNNKNLTRQIDLLNQMIIDQTRDGTKNLNHALMQTLNSLQSNFHQSSTRKNSLASTLATKRSDREKNRGSGNATIINLVEFIKEKKNRTKLYNLAIMKQEALKKEIDKQFGLDEMVSVIQGISPEEILYG